MDIMWNDALQGVAPITGGQPLPPATYRLRIIGGEGKLNSNQNLRLELQFEVESGPLKGRKAFHGENLPKGNTDADKQRMGYFLGLLSAFGLTGEQLGQMFAGRPIDEASVDYLAKMLVQSGRVVKGTCTPQKNDETRINWRNWTPDDGIEPEPPKQLQAAAPSGPPAPGFGAGGPGAFPQAGPPQNFPPQTQQAPNGFAPAAQGAPGGLPLGGFPGSGAQQPTPAPDWATQQPVQGQAPQPGPGQFAPAAQAAGLNQFQQPQAAQFPPQAPAPQQAAPDTFPGQQFPGQVNPAQFPPQTAPQQGFTPPAGLPGAIPAQQPAPAPAGLPQGGFPPVGQGQPPQANI